MSGANNNVKKTKGKQKIEIKYIENDDDRLVAYSKRRLGITNKASELATLTGAQVAFVTFPPSKRGKGKPYSFGYPSSNTVIKRFLGEEEVKDVAELIVEANRESNINALNEKLNDTTEKMNEKKEMEKKLKEQIDEGAEEVEAWWTTPIKELDQDGLVEIEESYKEILVEIFFKIKEKTRMNSGASSSSSGSANVTPLRVPAEQVPRFPTPPGYE